MHAEPTVIIDYAAGYCHLRLTAGFYNKEIMMWCLTGATLEFFIAQGPDNYADHEPDPQHPTQIFKTYADAWTFVGEFLKWL